jgi:cyanophycinase
MEEGRLQMMRIFIQLLLAVLLIAGVGSAFSLDTKPAAKPTKVGPKSGSLVIVGGGLTDAITQRFIDLAGGKDAPIVVIPTANGKDADGAGAVALFKRYGVTNITVLTTTDRSVANTDAFVAPLLTAKGVWLGGGRQWRLVDAYQTTKVEKELWRLLERDGVIGGSSAGATIQGSYLARGDTKNNQIMTGDHEKGFGFLKNVAIDQHLLARNRHFDMFAILKKYPKLLGIGIDEFTAIVVKGDRFTVLGDGNVAIYDGTFWSREGSKLKQLPDTKSLFYFLRNGDRYNLSERKVIQGGAR